MNWDALGAIAEMVGAAGVIASLVYLGAQIRQNTTALRASTWQTVNVDASDLFSLIGGSAETADLLRRGLAEPESLSESEVVQFHFVILKAFSVAENIFHQRAQGTISPEMGERVEPILVWYTRSPGFAGWWKRNQDLFSRPFRALVEEQVERPHKRAERL